MERATPQQTYDFILADLDEAAKTANTAIAKNKRWWVSRPAVEAMKARVYLFMQDYDKAATHAAEALKSGDAQLDDYNQLGYRVAQVSLDGEMKDVNYSELYRYGDNQVANYKENYLSEYFTGEYALIPSEDLLSLYDQDNDLRYKQFFNKYALWEQGIGGFGDDILYHKFKDKIQAGLPCRRCSSPRLRLWLARASGRRPCHWSTSCAMPASTRMPTTSNSRQAIRKRPSRSSWKSVTGRCRL